MYDANLEETYENLKRKNPRSAAEVAYVLAVLSKEKGDLVKARKYANESIGLFESIEANTLKDCASRYHILNGVSIPDLIHEDVVRDRLLDLFQ